MTIIYDHRRIISIYALTLYNCCDHDSEFLRWSIWQHSNQIELLTDSHYTLGGHRILMFNQYTGITQRYLESLHEDALTTFDNNSPGKLIMHLMIKIVSVNHLC